MEIDVYTISKNKRNVCSDSQNNPERHSFCKECLSGYNIPLTDRTNS